jgi:Fic family protein
VPTYVRRVWEGDPGIPGGRRARASFEYKAFLPDPIADLEPFVSFEVADLAADAERAIRDLNEQACVKGLESIGPLLLRSEAVGSSGIEGYNVSPLNLARALVDPRAARGSAKEVAANVSAMEEAIAIGNRVSPLVADDILAIHAILMAGNKKATPGEFRHEQNWIGGRLGNPSDARFIPPPEDEVPRLIEDLIVFMSRTDLPAVAQAAIAHAQFEAIHPFIDGNGRVGRCLIHIVLRRRGVAPNFVPPVSIVLAARSSSYMAGLVAFQEGRIYDWIASFSEATKMSASASTRLATDVAALQDEWRRRTGSPRADSAAAKLILLLPAQPVLSAPTARGAVGVSQQMTLAGLKALEQAGILRQISAGTYDRQFAATELFALISKYEEEVVGHKLSLTEEEH